jgi:hypothetical protein
MELLQVIGFPSYKKTGFCFNPLTGDLLYIAGSCIVVYSIEEDRQKDFLFNSKHSSYSCIDFSEDGRDLVAAEASKN